MELSEIAQLEQQLNQLKTLYEQYYMGIEKKEPVAARTKIRRAIVDASESPRNNTAVRFRASALKNKLITFENYWNRVNKEIEDGTYSRHKFKVRLHDQLAEEKRGGGAAPVDVAAKPKATGGFDGVIEQYRQMQKQSGQAPVDAAKLMATLQKQEAQLKEKFGAKGVEFRVVLEAGKPKLKAKPIK